CDCLWLVRNTPCCGCAKLRPPGGYRLADVFHGRCLPLGRDKEYFAVGDSLRRNLAHEHGSFYFHIRGGDPRQSLGKTEAGGEFASTLCRARDGPVIELLYSV